MNLIYLFILFLDTLLLPTIYLQHLTSESFKDPLKFLPERFDTSIEENNKNKDPYKFIPFGGGTRICIGMNFSLAEQRIFLAMLREYFFDNDDDLSICVYLFICFIY